MSQYDLRLLSMPIGGEVAAHYYWGIYDKGNGQITKAFHGGPVQDGEVIGFGLPDNDVGYGSTDDSAPLGTSIDSNKDHASETVFKFNSQAEADAMAKVFNAVGSEINNLGESYGIVFDNSNSVAWLLGKAVGLTDGQLKTLDINLQSKDGSLVGAIGFGDELLDGADGTYAGKTVAELSRVETETFMDKKGG